MRVMTSLVTALSVVLAASAADAKGFKIPASAFKGVANVAAKVAVKEAATVATKTATKEVASLATREVGVVAKATMSRASVPSVPFREVSGNGLPAKPSITSPVTVTNSQPGFWNHVGHEVVETIDCNAGFKSYHLWFGFRHPSCLGPPGLYTPHHGKQFSPYPGGRAAGHP